MNMKPVFIWVVTKTKIKKTKKLCLMQLKAVK